MYNDNRRRIGSQRGCALSNLARGTFTLSVDFRLGVPFALYFFNFPRVGTSKRATLSLPGVLFHENNTWEERRKNLNKEKGEMRKSGTSLLFSLSLPSPPFIFISSISYHSHLTRIRHRARIFQGNEACVRSSGLTVRLSISNQLGIRARLTYARSEGLKQVV